MAIQQNFPEEGPVLSLNFANSNTIDSRITFSRTSSGTCLDDHGLIRTISANEPRFEYNYDSSIGQLQSSGLLIEESRTNLLTRSEEFNDASWLKNSYNLTANAVTAPDGTLTADKIIPINSSTFHDVFKSPALGSGTYTFTIFAKAAEQSFVQLRIDDGAITRLAMFNLSNGTVSSSSNVTSPTIKSYPNNWYRCSITVTTNIGNVVVSSFPTSANGFYSGDGVSGIYIWGAQLEQGSFPTSYIPTIASTVTRSADNAIIVGTNFSAFYNSTEGTSFVQAIPSTDAAYTGYIYAIGSDFNNSISVYRQSDYQAVVRIRSSSVDIYGAIGYGANWTTANSRRIIVAFKTDSFNSAVNGSVSSDDLSGALPSFNSLAIGSLWGTLPFNGAISQLSCYPVRLANVQLQNLTK